MVSFQCLVSWAGNRHHGGKTPTGLALHFGLKKHRFLSRRVRKGMAPRGTYKNFGFDSRFLHRVNVTSGKDRNSRWRGNRRFAGQCCAKVRFPVGNPERRTPQWRPLASPRTGRKSTPSTNRGFTPYGSALRFGLKKTPFPPSLRSQGRGTNGNIQAWVRFPKPRPHDSFPPQAGWTTGKQPLTPGKNGTEW